MIYLASASPRRRELLTQIGIEFELLTVDVDESVLVGEAADYYVKRVAQLKAETAASVAVNDWPVLAADTSVVYDGNILGKPVDKADATRMLSELSNRTHQVLTAISVVYQGVVTTQLITTDVTFRSLSAIDIE